MPNPYAIRALGDTEIEDLAEILTRARRRVDAIIRGSAADTFSAFAALQRKQAIDAELDRLEADLVRRVGGAVERAVALALDADRGVLASFGASPLSGIDASIVQRVRTTGARMVRGITETARDRMRDAIVRVFSGEIDALEFERAIRDATDVPLSPARVERIVRTELSEAFVQQQAANDEALHDADAPLIKVWLHKGGGRPFPGARDEHIAMHGQERELIDLFNVGRMGDGVLATDETPPIVGIGHRANAPLDPSLPPEHRINCGCTYVRRLRSRARQPYIDKSRGVSRVAASRRA